MEAIADDQQADAHLGEVVLDRAVAVAAPGLSRHPGPHTRLTTPRCRGDGFRRASFLAVFRSRAFRACEQFRRAGPSQSATAADIASQAARPIGIHHQSMSTSL